MHWIRVVARRRRGDWKRAAILLLAGWMYSGCFSVAEAPQLPARPVPQAPAANSLPASPPTQPSTAAQPAIQPATPSAGPARLTGGRFLVLLDPAHGGTDNGAMLDASTPEKTYTLSLALRLRALLNAHGIRSVMTRNGDVTLDATTRAEIANRAHASACILLHATSSGNGVHLFTSSLAAAAQADPRRAFLPWQTAQAAYETQSLRLESDVDAALTKQQIPALVARSALMPLDSMICPAVIVEVAPLNATTPLSDTSYQQKIMASLAAALSAWHSDWRLQP